MTHRMLSVVSALLLALTGVAVLASPAPAHAYPPGGTLVTTDQSTYAAGDTMVITAAGFENCAGQPVVFHITPPGNGPAIVLTGKASAAGVATVSLRAPSTSGRYSVVASSPGCADAYSAFVVSGGLPQTGSDSPSWAVTAAALVFTGIGFWFVARRRRRTAAH